MFWIMYISIKKNNNKKKKILIYAQYFVISHVKILSPITVSCAETYTSRVARSDKDTSPTNQM